MKLLYSYQCRHCGELFTGWNQLSKRYTHPCKSCSELAELFINGGVHFRLDPVSGDFPSTTRKWEKSHEKANYDDLKSLGLRESEKRIFT